MNKSFSLPSGQKAVPFNQPRGNNLWIKKCPLKSSVHFALKTHSWYSMLFLGWDLCKLVRRKPQHKLSKVLGMNTQALCPSISSWAKSSDTAPNKPCLQFPKQNFLWLSLSCMPISKEHPIRFSEWSDARGVSPVTTIKLSPCYLHSSFKIFTLHLRVCIASAFSIKAFRITISERFRIWMGKKKSNNTVQVFHGLSRNLAVLLRTHRHILVTCP